jgi:tetratricopeptide (TPR) repeat protein
VAGETSWVEGARLLVEAQAHLRGDDDSAVRFYLSRAQEFASTPVANLAVRLALAINLDRLASVEVGEREARNLLAPDSGASGPVQDLARAFLIRTLLASRDPSRREEAVSLAETRGFALSWLVAGPFTSPAVFRSDLGGKIIAEAGSGTVGSVLDNPPDAATFARWRAHPPWWVVPESQALPELHPWDWTAGGASGAVVLRTGIQLENPESQVEFHLATGVSWQLYVDGLLVAAVDRNQEATSREHRVEIALPAGGHSLHLLLPPPPADLAPSDLGLTLRVVSASPFTWDRFAQPVAPPSGNFRRDARPPRYLTDLAQQKDSDPMLLALYALACREQGMLDEAAWSMSDAADRLPDNLAIRAGAGDLFAADSLLSPSLHRDYATHWHRSAIERHPDSVPSLLFLATLAMEAGRIDDAASYLARARVVNPASIRVLLADGDWSQRFANPPQILSFWRELAALYPTAPAVQRQYSSLPPERYRNGEERLEACRQAVEAGDPTPRSLQRLAEAEADTASSPREAASSIREALAAFPGDVNLKVWAGSLYARLGMYREATGVLREAISLSPWRADLWRQLGDTAKEEGDDNQAISCWRASLAADPGQPDLDDMVRSLAGTAMPLDYNGGYNAADLLAEIHAGQYPGDVVRLLDRSVEVMEADGSFRRLTHEVDYIQTQAGGESLSDVFFRGELLTARTIFPDGQSLESEKLPGRTGLRVPALLPGTAREIQYLESFPARANQADTERKPWFFQDPNGQVTFLLSEYEIRVPRGYPLAHVQHDYGVKVNFEKLEDGEREVYRWSARMGVPRQEPDAVHNSERLASVEAAQPVTWDDIVYRELSLLSGKLTPSRKMRTILASLSSRGVWDSQSQEEAARIIYRFVCDNILPPPPEGGGVNAGQIMADRLGDRNLLLLALLRQAGFDAHPAAARPNRNLLHPPTWELPRRDIFVIPLVRLTLLNGSTYWLDTRFDTLPFGRLADDLSEASLLTFLPTGPLFETLPILPLDESERLEERRVLLPGAGGKVKVVGSSYRRGVEGLRRRELMASPEAATQLGLMQELVFSVFPDAVITSLNGISRAANGVFAANHSALAPTPTLTGRGERLAPPGTDGFFSSDRYEAESAVGVERRGDICAVPISLTPPDIVSPETRGMRVRTTSCHIRRNHVTEERNTFVLPAGGEFLSLPEPREILSNFGFYQLRVSRPQANQVDIVRRYQVSAQRIRPWEWKDFLVFLQAIDRAESQWITYQAK